MGRVGRPDSGDGPWTASTFECRRTGASSMSRGSTVSTIRRSRRTRLKYGDGPLEHPRRHRQDSRTLRGEHFTSFIRRTSNRARSIGPEDAGAHPYGSVPAGHRSRPDHGVPTEYTLRMAGLDAGAVCWTASPSVQAGSRRWRTCRARHQCGAD